MFSSGVDAIIKLIGSSIFFYNTCLGVQNIIYMEKNGKMFTFKKYLEKVFCRKDKEKMHFHSPPQKKNFEKSRFSSIF